MIELRFTGSFGIVTKILNKGCGGIKETKFTASNNNIASYVRGPTTDLSWEHATKASKTFSTMYIRPNIYVSKVDYLFVLCTKMKKGHHSLYQNRDNDSLTRMTEN